MIRNSESLSFHCDTKLILLTRINVLTFRSAISLIATTVLPKAVVPHKMPLSCSNNFAIAVGWSSLSIPLNSTSIFLPVLVCSSHTTSKPIFSKSALQSASQPLGKHKYSVVSSAQQIILGLLKVAILMA